MSGTSSRERQVVLTPGLGDAGLAPALRRRRVTAIQSSKTGVQRLLCKKRKLLALHSVGFSLPQQLSKCFHYPEFNPLKQLEMLLAAFDL